VGSLPRTAFTGELFPGLITVVETRVTEVDIGDIGLSVTSAGNGPAVVLLHGFPEIGYSWRHQIPVLAEAGYRVLAPDLRGYGWSDAPDGVDAYTIDQLVGDVIGLLDAHEIDEAVIVGHDWGALIAPWVALFRPDRVRGVALLSVPYVPRGDLSPVGVIKANDPDGEFAYVIAFQESGVEELFEADPMETLRRIYWTACGARPDGIRDGAELPKGLPPHLSAGEFENYYRAFAKSGFANPINYYRNFDQNHANTRPWHQAQLRPPTLFIAGDRDFVATTSDGVLGAGVSDLVSNCADLRGVHLIEGAGHWVQQESPDAVNELLVSFCDDVWDRESK